MAGLTHILAAQSTARYLVDLEQRKSKIIHVYRNGDAYSRAALVVLRPIEQKAMERIIKAIEEKIILTNNKPIRRLFTENGDELEKPEDVLDQKYYVAASAESFISVNYGSELKWAILGPVRWNKFKDTNYDIHDVYDIMTNTSRSVSKWKQSMHGKRNGSKMTKSLSAYPPDKKRSRRAKELLLSARTTSRAISEPPRDKQIKVQVTDPNLSSKLPKNSSETTTTTTEEHLPKDKEDLDLPPSPHEDLRHGSMDQFLSDSVSMTNVNNADEANDVNFNPMEREKTIQKSDEEDEITEKTNEQEESIVRENDTALNDHIKDSESLNITSNEEDETELGKYDDEIQPDNLNHREDSKSHNSEQQEESLGSDNESVKSEVSVKYEKSSEDGNNYEISDFNEKLNTSNGLKSIDENDANIMDDNFYQEAQEDIKESTTDKFDDLEDSQFINKETKDDDDLNGYDDKIPSQHSDEEKIDFQLNNEVESNHSSDQELEKQHETVLDKSEHSDEQDRIIEQVDDDIKSTHSEEEQAKIIEQVDDDIKLTHSEENFNKEDIDEYGVEDDIAKSEPSENDENLDLSQNSQIINNNNNFENLEQDEDKVNEELDEKTDSEHSQDLQNTNLANVEDEAKSEPSLDKEECEEKENEFEKEENNKYHVEEDIVKSELSENEENLDLSQNSQIINEKVNVENLEQDEDKIDEELDEQDAGLGKLADEVRSESSFNKENEEEICDDEVKSQHSRDSKISNEQVSHDENQEFIEDVKRDESVKLSDYKEEIEPEGNEIGDKECPEYDLEDGVKGTDREIEFDNNENLLNLDDEDVDDGDIEDEDVEDEDDEKDIHISEGENDQEDDASEKEKFTNKPTNFTDSDRLEMCLKSDSDDEEKESSMIIKEEENDNEDENNEFDELGDFGDKGDEIEEEMSDGKDILEEGRYETQENLVPHKIDEEPNSIENDDNQNEVLEVESTTDYKAQENRLDEIESVDTFNTDKYEDYSPDIPFSNKVQENCIEEKDEDIESFDNSQSENPQILDDNYRLGSQENCVEEIESDENEAATKIQAKYRGYQVRKMLEVPEQNLEGDGFESDENQHRSYDERGSEDEDDEIEDDDDVVKDISTNELLSDGILEEDEKELKDDFSEMELTKDGDE